MYIKYQFPNITLVIMKVLGSTGDILHCVMECTVGGRAAASPLPPPHHVAPRSQEAAAHTLTVTRFLQTRQLHQI